MRFGVVLDSGCVVSRHRLKGDAKDFLKSWNAKARADRAAGEIPFRRFAIGIVTHKKTRRVRK